MAAVCLLDGHSDGKLGQVFTKRDERHASGAAIIRVGDAPARNFELEGSAVLIRTEHSSEARRASS